MGRVLQKSVLFAGLVSICELTALHAALAEPPLQKVTAALSHPANAPERNAPSLDLRAPAQLPPTDQVLAAASGNHRLFGREALFHADTPANAEQSGHIMSPLQNMAHNYQKEGLPIAKLFQSDNSLVHVGLNPKGKPGLWFVHKLH
jgi:hypothetical protein